MTHDDPGRPLKSAGAALDEALRHVAAGGAESLDRGLAYLGEARTGLEDFLAAARRGSAATGGERHALAAIAESLTRLRARLAFAEEYYQGWMRVRATLAGGYTPPGTAPTQPEGCRLLAEG